MDIEPFDRPHFIVDLQLVFLRDHSVLLSKRKHTGYYDGYWGLVSGHLENGESLRAGACREAEEEIGIVLLTGQIEFLHLMNRREDDCRLTVFFGVQEWEGEIRNLEPKKCEALSWFPLNKFPAATVPFVARFLADMSGNYKYSESGFSD